MNLRKAITFGCASLLGYNFPALYAEYLHAVTQGDPACTAAGALRDMLLHCKRSVPYYAELMAGLSQDDISEDPEACLRTLPILTKDIIRAQFDRLKSNDLNARKWYYNTSGGSTGVPIKLIQDKEYRSRVRAITMLFSRLVGREEGEPVLYLWGSEREILESSAGIKATLSARVLNTSLVNAFRMTPQKMRECLEGLDRRPPKLIIAYAQSLYELACFARREGITITAQNAAITSAGTLYEFMRDEITRLLKCPVYNRYGSREVSAIACERPGLHGLWVAPWGNYVEVVGPTGTSQPAGAEGDLVITCLTNYAMPLLRYEIGDRGVLADAPQCGGQVLTRLLGRSVDSFKLHDGTCVDGEYFTHLLYFRDWVHKFQIIQQDYDAIVVKVQLADRMRPSSTELAEIAANARAVMGQTCRINFEFPPEIQHSPSGKFRFTISEVH
jgi:phenylacetate-coenzyme A ligase PaaK-like adenylate-forming protein